MTEWFAAGLVTGLFTAGFFYWVKGRFFESHIDGCCVCWKHEHDRKSETPQDKVWQAWGKE